MVINMQKERSEQILEDFNLWLKTKFTNVFWFRGHKFEKAEGEGILIDGGFFTEEEAKEIFKMLNSKNPISRLNATFIIWERNGILLKLLIVLSVVALILIYIRIRK